MGSRLHQTLISFTGITLFLFQLIFANPTLVPGTWLNISPPQSALGQADVFCQGMAIDPNNPATLYLGICAFDVAKGGLYKTTNAGSTWAKISNLDEPVHVIVDPNNSSHLYCVNGVRGNTQGFWISTDGGNNWTKPAGFTTATANPVGTQDLYSIAVEPGNFNHILVSFHSPWNNGSNNAGVLESTDGGASWVVHNPPAGAAGGYGMAIFFLDFPKLNQGNKNTWLFTAQQGGFFKTTDAGATWAQVYNNPMTHGGNQIYCSVNGTLYSGGYQYPARSTDNGASWQQTKTGLDYSWYMGVCGDGKSIYVGSSGTARPFFVSPETDGLTWTQYQGGAQKFSSNPFEMFFDNSNGIMYSANWEGLYALKVLDWSKVIRSERTLSPKSAQSAQNRALIIVDEKTARSGSAIKFFDIRGKSLGGNRIGMQLAIVRIR